jgi:predicted aldo/keto reductase-like oxidoreductase
MEVFFFCFARFLQKINYLGTSFHEKYNFFKTSFQKKLNQVIQIQGNLVQYVHYIVDISGVNLFNS